MQESSRINLKRNPSENVADFAFRAELKRAMLALKCQCKKVTKSKVGNFKYLPITKCSYDIIVWV